MQATWIRCGAVVAFAIGLGACGQQSAAPDMAIWPSFPADRDASVATPLLQNGSAAILLSANATPSGTNLVLPGTANKVEYGEWRFTSADPILSLTIDKTSAAGSYYLGVADYASLRWKILGPFGAASNQVDLTGGSFASPGNHNFYCFIATFGNGPSTTVQSLMLTVDSPAITYSISGHVSEGANPLAGVTIDLSGAATASTSTDLQGDYSFSGLAPGGYTLTPSKSGYGFAPPLSSQTVSNADIAGVTFIGGNGLYQPDTLYCVPQVSTAPVDTPIMLLIISGPTANPFHYMSGLGLTMENDGTYVPQTFQYGDIGGDAVTYTPFGPVYTGPPDGLWATIAPTDFICMWDSFLVPTDIGGGRNRWDFNITPTDGGQLTGASGTLLNVEFQFSTPGTKNFGFVEQDSVKRTYYSDDSSNEYFWGNSANDGSGGVLNSVLIQ